FVPLPPDVSGAIQRRPGDVLATAVAAWQAVLMRQQGSEAGMCLAELGVDGAERAVVGPLNSPTPVRCEAGDEPIAALLDRVREALGTEPVAPFARLLEACPPARDLSRPPLAQTAVRCVDARAPLVAAAG